MKLTDEERIALMREVAYSLSPEPASGYAYECALVDTAFALGMKPRFTLSRWPAITAIERQTYSSDCRVLEVRFSDPLTAEAMRAFIDAVSKLR